MVQDEQGKIHVSTTEARGGATPGMARYVLVISLVVVVVAFAVILLVWR